MRCGGKDLASGRVARDGGREKGFEMPAGRPRTPISIADISGATRKNPQRYRERRTAAQIKQRGIGKPPKEWVDGAKTNARCATLVGIWKEIVGQDVLHVLNLSHRILVENTCHLMYKIRRASMGYGKATSGDYAQVKSNLAAMGMTPVDSPRVAEAVRVSDPDAPAGKRRAEGWGELVG